MKLGTSSSFRALERSLGSRPGGRPLGWAVWMKFWDFQKWWPPTSGDWREICWKSFNLHQTYIKLSNRNLVKCSWWGTKKRKNRIPMMFKQISFPWFASSKQLHRPKMIFHQQLYWGTAHVPHDRGDQKHFGFQPTRFLTAGEALAFSDLRSPFHQVSKKTPIFSPKRSVFVNVNHFLIFGASCFFYCKLIENRIIPLLVVGFAPWSLTCEGSPNTIVSICSTNFAFDMLWPI